MRTCAAFIVYDELQRRVWAARDRGGAQARSQVWALSDFLDYKGNTCGSACMTSHGFLSVSASFMLLDGDARLGRKAAAVIMSLPEVLVGVTRGFGTSRNT